MLVFFHKSILLNWLFHFLSRFSWNHEIIFFAYFLKLFFFTTNFFATTLGVLFTVLDLDCYTRLLLTAPNCIEAAFLHFLVLAASTLLVLKNCLVYLLNFDGQVVLLHLRDLTKIEIQTTKMKIAKVELGIAAKKFHKKSLMLTFV